MTERTKNGLCLLGVTGMMLVAACGGTTGSAGPVKTDEAKANDPNIWCEGYNACVLKDFEQITPSMLNQMTTNGIDCNKSGAVSIPLAWERDLTKSNSDAYKITRVAITCVG